MVVMFECTHHALNPALRLTDRFGKTIDMGGGYGLDLNIGPYWNVVKPNDAADWFLKFGVTLLFP